jgi:DNA-binding LytR/AlgR family response regulator
VRALLLPLLLAFLLTAGSVGLVHLWLPDPQPVSLVLLHAVQVGTAYTLWLVVAAAGLVVLRWRGRLTQLRVGHLWAISLGCYVLGYFVDLFRGDLVTALHADVADAGSLFHFLRLLPVWLLVTFLFVQPWAHHTLTLEIGRLSAINARLAVLVRPAPAISPRLQLEVGRTRLDLPIDSVTHISVDDHYCWVHCWRDGRASKTALGLPLRDLQPHLPAHFVQVHRSHVVNLHQVTNVIRQGRECRLLVPGVESIPVSRQRVREVLAQLDDSDSTPRPDGTGNASPAHPAGAQDEPRSVSR